MTCTGVSERAEVDDKIFYFPSRVGFQPCLAGYVITRLHGVATDPIEIDPDQPAALFHHLARDEHRVDVARRGDSFGRWESGVDPMPYGTAPAARREAIDTMLNWLA